MASANPIVQQPTQTRVYHPLHGLLSYLVPGLGQIVQGRVAKGVLFLVCIYALFFYGIYLGSGSVKLGDREYRGSSVVYLPDMTEASKSSSNGNRVSDSTLYTRPQFLGQFWVGVVVWPAILQHLRYDRKANEKVEEMYDEADRKQAEDPDEAKKLRKEAADLEQQLRLPLLGDFQREPSQATINAIHNAGDKRLELAWVFTVIAGVLNILVIYDAVVGPSHGPAPSQEKKR
jgi:hypothetical protein